MGGIQWAMVINPLAFALSEEYESAKQLAACGYTKRKHSTTALLFKNFCDKQLL